MSNRSEIELRGCTGTSLGGYLKALGVLRIVSKQLDPSCRGFWRAGTFWLDTMHSQEDLVHFFLSDYSPTPFLAPWNNGSGFYSIKGDGTSSIEKLESSTADRFDSYRSGIRDAKATLTAILGEWQILESETKDKAKTEDEAEAEAKARDKAREEVKSRLKQLKSELVLDCKRRWRGAHRDWLDAAVIVSDSGQLAFPPVLGTGGNDAKLDFSAKSMERVCELFSTTDAKGGPARIARPALEVSILGENRPNFKKKECKIGQFDPGAAGGANSTTGDEGKSYSDPWSLTLILEGALLLSPRLLRRLSPIAGARAASPFSVSASQNGYSTAGSDKAERGEQWLPLWEPAATLQEIRQLFAESRMQINGRPATNTLDAIRSITSRGCARGVSEFVRIAYFERFGQQRLAIPLGRIPARPRSQNRLLDDLAEWIARLERESDSKEASQAFVTAQRRLSDSVIALLTHDESPKRWQAVLIAAAQLEAIMARGVCFSPGPIPPLRPDWLARSNDGSAEWRLALSLGSSAELYCSHGSNRHEVKNSVRHHFLPLEDSHRYAKPRFKTSDNRLVTSSPRLVGKGRGLTQSILSVAERRMIESRQEGKRRLPLSSAPGYAAQERDLVQFIAGRVDSRKTLELARAVMAIDWSRVPTPAQHNAQATTLEEPRMSLPWWTLRVSLLPWPLDGDTDIPAQFEVLRRCRAGDISGACRLALRRMQIIGRPGGYYDAFHGVAHRENWVAALAFPISKQDARTAIGRIHRNPT